MSNRKLRVVSMIGAGVLLVGLGGAAAVSTMAAPAATSSITQAIANKDLDAFKKAIIDSATTKANSITQDDFNKITANAEKRQAVDTAIDNNDYNAFKAAADTKMLERVNSQTEFDKLVTERKAQKEKEAKILTAVQNNDLDAYKTIMKDTTNQPTGKDGKTRPVPTDDELKTQFDKLVEYYKTNNSLPEHGGFGGGLGGDGGHGGGFGKGGPDDLGSNVAPGV